MNLWAAAGLTAASSVLAAGYLRDRREGREVRQRLTGEDHVVVAKSNHTFDPVETVQWLMRLSQFRRPQSEHYIKGQVEFVWRIEKNEKGEVWFYFRVPEDRRRGVQQVLPPTMEWHEVTREVQEKKVEYPSMWLGLEREMLPIRKVSKRDVLLTLLRALAPQMALEVTFSPADTKNLLRKLKKVHTALDPQMQAKSAGGANELLTIGQESLAEIGAAFMGKERTRTTAAKSPPKPVLFPHEGTRVQKIKDRYADISGMMNVTMKLEMLRPEKSPHVYFQSVLGALMDVADENRIVQQRRRTVFPLSCEELATFVHVPAPAEWSHMPIIREHARTLRDDEFAEGVAVGYLRHPIQKERLISIPDRQFQTHFLLSGQTGSGKSSTLVFLIQSLIDRWATSTNKRPQPGFTLMDPAEETALIVLSRLQAALPPDSPLWEKVHYLSFSNTEYPVGMNLMQVIGVDGLLSLLQGNYGGGAQMDRLIRNSIETLQSDPGERHVVAGISSLLRDSNWRNRIVPTIRDEFVRLFWERDFPTLEKNPNVFQPVENRLSPFLSGTQRLYFGQPDYALPIRKWMDEGHIFLIDVKALGKDLMHLIGGSLIEHYHWTAQKRPQSTSLNHYLLVDECHRAQSPSMPSIIKEDRKFGLVQGLITQSVEQFNPELKREIKDNLGNILSLRQGVEGSRTIAELSNGHFDVSDLRGFDNLVCAVCTKADGRAESVETSAPYPILMKGFHGEAQPVNFEDKKATAERYQDLREFAAELQKKIGRPRQEVQEDLNFYLRKGRWPNRNGETDSDRQQAGKETPSVGAGPLGEDIDEYVWLEEE